MSDIALLPTFVQVGHRRYPVTIDRAKIDRLSYDRQERLLGHADHALQVITIAPDLGDDIALEVLVHEVLHCVTDVVGINSDMDEEAEEKLVNRLAPALIDLLRRNPELVEAIVA